MIFTGTAAELAELTRKHWGAEWWPKGLMFHPCGRWCYEDHGSYRNAGEVAAAIFAAAYIHLAKDGTRATGMTLFDDGRARIGGGFDSHPSPLHAVLAAVEVVG